MGALTNNMGKIFACIVSLVTIVAMALAVVPAHAEDNRVADPSTHDGWQHLGVPANPASTGRVWTDKSVYTGNATFDTVGNGQVTVSSSDSQRFLVGLSALSSTLRSRGVNNVTKPADVMLVLDTSGSMRESMDGGWGGPSRLDSLKQAVNGFLDSAEEYNKTAPENLKSRVGLVTYASDSYIHNKLTTDLGAVRGTVNSLRADGATRADYGVRSAQEALANSNVRADAKKMVVFLTDGVPTVRNTFSPEVANGAVATTKTLKDAGYTVYSIGIFRDANPGNVDNGTSDANRFMHALSSNYPNAVSYRDLGERASNDYYLTANNAGALSKVFEQIWDNVITNPTSPIAAGANGEKGYVTITDTLGSYMTVKNMNSVVFAGQKFENPQTTTSPDGKTTTYTFSGAVAGNAVFGGADLKDLQITVTHNEGAQGDVVTVRVPENLLPLRLHDVSVDKNGDVATCTTDADPIRVFYEVGLKDGAEQLVAKPDDAMKQYIAGHSADGKVDFFTNQYEEAHKTNGSTTAEFTPANTNDYYRFVSDTPLYTAQDEKATATSFDENGSYYYKRSYYEGNRLNDQWVNVSGKMLAGKVARNNAGRYQVTAGQARVGLLVGDTAAKASNPTGTSANSIATAWESSVVRQHLGNNGKLTLAIPTPEEPKPEPKPEQPTPGKPEQPNPNKPSEQPKPEQPKAEQPKQQKPSKVASTGSSVAYIALAAAICVAAGVTLILVRERKA
ncbi:type IV secretion protein Rhs [Bifidobacterium animalis subsp. animalis]|nr:type IV secretion protein Rhs [Bifidobacterium animalis subsp. animalis]